MAPISAYLVNTIYCLKEFLTIANSSNSQSEASTQKQDCKGFKRGDILTTFPFYYFSRDGIFKPFNGVLSFL